MVLSLSFPHLYLYVNAPGTTEQPGEPFSRDYDLVSGISQAGAGVDSGMPEFMIRCPGTSLVYTQTQSFRDHLDSAQVSPFNSPWRTGSPAPCEELVSLSLVLWAILGTK